MELSVYQHFDGEGVGNIPKTRNQRLFRLRNTKNHCFGNSAANALFSIPAFHQFIKNPRTKMLLKTGKGSLHNQLLQMMSVSESNILSQMIKARTIVASDYIYAQTSPALTLA